MRKKRRKKTKRKILEDKCDKLWAELVKIRANNQCEYCGKKTYLNSHHAWSRSNKNVRWDIENGVCLCASHHALNSKFSAHLTGLEFAEWIKSKRGIEWYLTMQGKAQRVWNKDIDYIYEQLKKEYEKVYKK